MIAEPRSDRYLGEVLLFKREWETGEIAYVVAPSVRGRGIATDAVKLLATKAGFQREGYMHDYLKIRGEWRDHLLYALVSNKNNRYGALSI